MATLVELATAAAAATDLQFIPPGKTKFGGVDPLGLRQINFDLMDDVLPGLNNVARHIKPFVVVSWAWRRALQLARALGQTTIKQSELQDFVDRIEVLYVLSQLQRDKKSDLPGTQYLAPWLQESEFKFGGTKWQQRRKERRYSTALSAPINYGPGLKMLGWLAPHPEYPGVMMPNPDVAPALDALDTRLGRALDHDAFNKFGSITAASEKVRKWGELWAIDDVTDIEAKVMSDLLFGSSAPLNRRYTGELMLAAVSALGTSMPERIRAAMTGAPSGFAPGAALLETRDKWRLLQMRQLFRLSLEGFFSWTMNELAGPKRSIHFLVKHFVAQATGATGARAGDWLGSLLSPKDGPIELMARLEAALKDPTTGELPNRIAEGLAFSLAEPTPDLAQQQDRLPLWRAQQEAAARSGSSVDDFLRHVLESWVLAQHAYWSVGRGLADARAGGRILLRLRIILDEGGWTLTPGAPLGGRPQPTPDRLHTALTLARECGLLG